MLKEGDVLEVPVTGSTSVNEVVELFNHNKIYKVKHPKIQLKPVEKDLEILALYLILSAFERLAKQGKIKEHYAKEHVIPHMQNIRNVSVLHGVIEKKYDIDLRVGKHIKAKTIKEHKKKEDFMLNEVFGIWKDKNITLDKIREAQWVRKK